MEQGQARHPYTIPLVLELWFVLVPLSEEKNRFVYKPAKESVAGGSFIFLLIFVVLVSSVVFT